MKLSGCVLSLLLCSSALALEPARVELQVLHGADTQSCPDAAEVQSRVAARLGYDPFVAGAARRLDVELAKDEARFSARVRSEGGERVLKSRGLDCGSLLDPLALTLSLAIDPTRASAPVAELARTPLPVVLPAPAAAPPLSWRSGLQLGLGTDYGSAPGFGAELAVQGRLRRSVFSLGAEATAGFTPWVRLESGEARTFSLRLGVVPCVEVGVLGLCALADAGAIQAFARGVPNAQSAVWPEVATGVRVQLSLPVSQDLTCGVLADASVRWIRTHLTAEESRVWSAQPFRFGVRAFVRFGG